MELCFIRPRRNFNFPLDRFGVRLIVLGQSFSDVSGAKPDHGVFTCVIVRCPPEYFNSNHTFAK